jgi:hypothetical protein
MFYAMKEMLVLIKCAVNVDAEMVSFMICVLSHTQGRSLPMGQPGQSEQLAPPHT